MKFDIPFESVRDAIILLTKWGAIGLMTGALTLIGKNIVKMAKWSWNTYQLIKDRPVTINGTWGFIIKFCLSFMAASAISMMIFFRIQSDEFEGYLGKGASNKKLDLRITELERVRRADSLILIKPQ